MQIICQGSKLWQLSAFRVIAFLKYIQAFKYLLLAENTCSMTDRAYMGEVMTQVWLQSIRNE